jgi:hypothetical protein
MSVRGAVVQAVGLSIKAGPVKPRSVTKQIQQEPADAKNWWRTGLMDGRYFKRTFFTF